MEFGFGRERDAALFNDPRRLRQKYGARCAEKIEARLAQITAAATLDILCQLPKPDATSWSPTEASSSPSTSSTRSA